MMEPTWDIRTVIPQSPLPARTRVRGLVWQLSEPETPADPGSASPIPEAAGIGVVRQKLRILIIEDNQDFADNLRLFFELLGYEAAVAHTGIEGVAAALRHLPNVVICDIGLPGMDGFEVARTLRDNPLTTSARLIAVTGYGSESDVQESLSSGFDAHLVKPVEVGELLKLIEAEKSAGD